MKTKTDHQALAACLFPLEDFGTNDAIQLFPAGQFDAPDGALSGKGPWILNADIAKKLIAATGTKQNILIDYDHQSLLFTKNLEPLESAGTFAGANLEWREGVGLFATNVHWTAASKAHFAKDKYRFISPLFTYDANTGEVTRLISVALTDNPAIKNMQAIELAAASLLKQQSNPPEENMNKELLTLLGLSDDADDKSVLAACSALKENSDKSTELSAQIDTLTREKDALAATAGKVDASKYVPITVVSELQEKIAALSTNIEAEKVAKLIESNKTKLLTPGLKDWAGKQTLAALTLFLDAAPEIPALSGMQSDGNKPPDGSDSSQSIIAAASKYQHEQQQLGNEISVADAVSHVTHSGAK